MASRRKRITADDAASKLSSADAASTGLFGKVVAMLKRLIGR